VIWSGAHEPVPRALIHHRVVRLSGGLHRIARVRDGGVDTRVVPTVEPVHGRLDVGHRVFRRRRPVKHDGRSVETFVVYPESKAKTPVVLVIHEIFGLTDWVEDVADQFAEAAGIDTADLSKVEQDTLFAFFDQPPQCLVKIDILVAQPDLSFQVQDNDPSGPALSDIQITHIVKKISRQSYEYSGKIRRIRE
jgi:hypothetical protein